MPTGPTLRPPVATADGKVVTRGDVRRAVEFYRAIDGTLTNDEATNRTIVQVIDPVIMQAEVERREVAATDEEAQAYMTKQRNLCLGDHGAECREAVAQLGFDTSDDDYWNNTALPEYKRMVGEIKLFQAIIEEGGLADATEEEIIAAQSALPGQLGANANIVWHDDDLRQKYQSALPAK